MKDLLTNLLVVVIPYILVNVNGHNVTGLTMGAVWELLQGIPGTAFILVIERAGKQITVQTAAHHFLR